MQLFGPAQAAVARAVVDSVAEGVIPKDQVDDLCIIVGVFIHWEAEDDKKIYDYNYEAVKAVDRARAQRRAEHRQGARRHAGRASPVRRRRRGASSKPLTAQTGEPPLAGLRTVVTGASSGIGRGDRGRVRGRRRPTSGSASGARPTRPQALAGELGGPIIRCCRRTSARVGRLRGDRRSGVRRARADRRLGQQRRRRRAHGRGRDRGRTSASSRRCSTLDLKATIRCSRLVAARMRPGGCILNMGWDHATDRTGWPATTPSCSPRSRPGCSASRSRSRARSRPTSASTCCAPGGSRPRSAQAPTATSTRRSRDGTPLGRWGRPEDVAGAAVWLASPGGGVRHRPGDQRQRRRGWLTRCS